MRQTVCRVYKDEQSRSRISFGFDHYDSFKAAKEIGLKQMIHMPDLIRFEVGSEHHWKGSYERRHKLIIWVEPAITNESRKKV